MMPSNKKRCADLGGGRGKAQRVNIVKLGSIVNLGSGCALRINDDSAPP